MRADQRYRINTPSVTHQIIDGEAVMINFESGSYYNLNPAGAFIWTLLEQRLPVSALVAAVQQRHAGPPDRIAASVHRLLERLRAEDLIRETDSGADQPAELAPGAPEPSDFVEPDFQKYDDLQALLLVDAIHQVDEAGWPVAPPPNPPPA